MKFSDENELAYYANIDAMIGELNRRVDLKLLGRKLHSSKIYGYNIIICFVDIDRLKLIHDTFCHEEVG